MAPLKILICGGGIAGPALAFWLSKLGHDVTIVERFPCLRASGQQLDLRGPGIQVMKRMGLEDLFRSQGISEVGMQFVDDHGKQKAFYPVNKSGKGLQSFTTDYEIMRGDLCRMLYNLTKDRVNYIFGVHVERLEQDSDLVRVKFSDGKKDQFDLVVGADGQGSHTRRMMLGPDAPDPFHFLGLYIAYFTRFVFTRRHARDTIQAYLGYCAASEKLENVRKSDIQEQKEVWAQLFADAAWKTPRIIRDMQNDTAANDFYSQKVGQVRLDSWSRGRVVLVGDAAYCPSPATGMGTTSSLTGAYVLAGEIAKYCGRLESSDGPKDPLFTALNEYDRKFRPFMKEVQTLGPGMPNIVAPETRWGISVMHFILWLAALLGIDAVAQWFLREKNAWDLPYYEELDISTQERPEPADAKKSR
ncbi:FAD/NAD(P)-binding domain-containing protein [Aspergillus novofumigatus IBT 16806]|uniref:FAD/NAD(P)-binding domain-containing protein n=1 Tax=Aspergillus novofumigatus (strain IBT 16806) TaxID=1392255 RepID=A0A2I1CHC5_ASPN1|nr:FAD/NAD(P)-binding domain-containing protein [Aspergillus novofumigatus IBT 16806]PKX97017.1 FAD/NAD(P)-binding domain-containing protein [Aspergillus novofumigatus IBT 16806]